MAYNNDDPFASIGASVDINDPIQRQQAAMNFFKSRGWDDHQAAGIVGNLIHESNNLDPSAVGDSGASIGLAQWNSGRRRALSKFAPTVGGDSNDFMTQLQFVDHELNNDEKDAGEALRKAKSVQEAARIFSERFERPGKPMMDSRINNAIKMLSGAFGPSEATAESDPFAHIGVAKGEVRTVVTNPFDVIANKSVTPKKSQERQEFISEEREPGRTKAESISTAPEQSLGQKIAETVSPYVRPILEIGGLAGGGVAGTAGEPGAGTLVGAGLGYGLGKKAADALDAYAGVAPVPTIKESLIQSAKDVGTGAAMEAGGQVGGVVVPKVLGAAGKLGRTFAGKMAGTGSEVAKDALESGKSTGLPFMHPVENIKAGKSLNPLASTTNFDKALRGEIKGKEIIDSFKGALDQIAETRRTEYLDALGKIPNQQVDIAPMKQKVLDLLVGKRPGEGFVRTDASGALDWSRSSLGGENTEGVRRIRDAAEMVANWGSKPGDDTILGLDMLKRHIDGLYGETSQAKAFITQLRNTVKKTITDAVPEYGKLTKKYQEASGLINDVEGLIGRKASSGMIGNIVADQSLRRLMSAMRNDRELQKEVIDVLGKTAGEDLSGLVSGFSMKTGLPVGLAGTGPTLLGEIALAHYVNPAFWPVLAASSPRLQGEFLRMYGQVLAETKGMSLPVSKIMSYLAMRKQELKKSPKESENAQE